MRDFFFNIDDSIIFILATFTLGDVHHSYADDKYNA
jgi:hypothetical protein